MDFKHFSVSDVGLVRPVNEDNCGDRMTANGYVFVVCDGMGGHVGGAKASALAVECILNFFENPVQNIYVGINDAFQFANAQIFNTAQNDPSLNGMGTTGTILIIKEDACFIGHVGDSRIYLKSDGKLNRLTKDHSFVQGLVDQGIINDADAENHPKKNEILEALGIKQTVNPTVCDTPIHPKEGDCFLMCSDGLNGMVNDAQIESIIDPDNPENSGHSLIAAANQAGGSDNITATLVTITESQYAASTFVNFNPAPTHGTTIIEPQAPIQESSNNRKLLIILISSIGGLLVLAALYLFVFKGGAADDRENPPKKPEIEEVDDKDKDVKDTTPDGKLNQNVQGHEQQNGESGNENPTVGVGEEDPVDEEDKDPEPEEGNNSKEEGQDPQPEEEKNDSTEHQGGGNLR